jgi:polysaccharide biosynthesis/export protein
MVRKLLALVMTAPLLLGGCARVPVTPEAFTLSNQEIYRLATGDRLRILVFGQDSLSNTYTVDASGRIAFPLIGTVPAKGLTTADLEAALSGRLRGGFLREPQISVEVDQYRPFFILGEVKEAGQFPFVNGTTIQSAVAIAGGFAPRAARTYAELTRLVNGEMVTANVPINFQLRPGDTVVIKERYF